MSFTVSVSRSLTLSVSRVLVSVEYFYTACGGIFILCLPHLSSSPSLRE